MEQTEPCYLDDTITAKVVALKWAMDVKYMKKG